MKEVVIRYVLRFWLTLALGLMLMGGCSEGAGPQCEQNEDCDDQNECTEDRCQEGTCSNAPFVPHGHLRSCDFDGVPAITWIEDGICVDALCVKNPCDDGNECTADGPPRLEDGACFYSPCDGCRPCDWEDTDDGVCIEDVCEEDPCHDVVCDDGDRCTDDVCDYRDGTCQFSPHCPARACNTVWCDPADGSCHYTPANDGTTCGRYCVFGDPVCRGGTCICLVGSAGAFEVQP